MIDVGYGIEWIIHHSNIPTVAEVKNCTVMSLFISLSRWIESRYSLI